MRRLMADALGIYVASRCVGLAILLLVEDELHGRRFAGGPPFRLWWEALGRWDAVFYRMVAVDGYPATLPTDAGGAVLANTWAFFPLFPLAAALVSRITGLAFEPAAVLLNVAVGAMAAVCLARLVRLVHDDDAALRAVGMWGCFPTAFVLQVPYSEACYAACACGFLLALLTRRLGVAAVLLVGAALSRGYILPLSAAAAVVIVREVRASGPGSWRRPAVVSLAAAAAVAPWLWMLVAALVTGRRDAYAATQQVWGFSFAIGPAIDRWQRVLGVVGHDVYATVTILTLLIVSAIAVLAWRSRLPIELRVYAVVATLFLLAISQPDAVAFGSVPRFAFGILSIPIVLALRVNNAAAVAIAVTGLALQYLWVFNIWSGRLGIAP